MQIRVGGKYRTRDGRVATVIADRGDSSFIATVSDDRGGNRIYRPDGTWCFSSGGSGLDLISEISPISEIIQIRVGRKYRTRDGRQAVVAATIGPNPFSGGGWRLAGFIAGEPATCGWFTDGINQMDRTISRYDLIGPWKEPIEVPISDDFTAVVTDKIVVGCTEISQAKADELQAALKRYAEL